jgi:hypothetical protein
LYLLSFIELHRSGTPIFKRVTESSRVTVSDEGRALQLVDRALVMVSRRKSSGTRPSVVSAIAGSRERLLSARS